MCVETKTEFDRWIRIFVLLKYIDLIYIRRKYISFEFFVVWTTIKNKLFTYG